MSFDPVQKFQSLRDKSDFVFAVVYRGDWCPFCMSYVKSLGKLSPSITAASGVPVIITAQPENSMSKTRGATGYQGEAIADPENKLISTWREQGLIDVAVSSKGGYEHGMAQPAILVLKKDGTVVEKWAIQPSLMNLGGASDRPILTQVWDNVQAKLRNNETVHKDYTHTTFRGMIGEKLFGKA